MTMASAAAYGDSDFQRKSVIPSGAASDQTLACLRRVAPKPWAQSKGRSRGILV